MSTAAPALTTWTLDASHTDAGFAVDDNRVSILDAEGGREDLPLLPKYEVSSRILDRQ